MIPHMAPKLLIRADASGLIGTGHMMRCLALAQAWQDAGGQALFLASECQTPLKRRLLQEGFALKLKKSARGSEADADATITAARAFGAEWVVADGYRFGSKFQKSIKAASLRLLIFDDYGHADRYEADIVLNQNLYATDSLYRRRAPETELCLGPRFVQLRREFARWRGWERTFGRKTIRVLVTMGGSDPQNATPQVIDALASWPGMNWEALVVVGPANPRHHELAATVRRLGLPEHVIKQLPDMPEAMAWADVAIAAAGTTSWEMAFMGLPAAVSITADNQKAVAESLHAHGLAINLGPLQRWKPERLKPLFRDAATRRRMSKRGRSLIDGEGAARVVMRLLGHPLRLRPAEAADCGAVWKWANDPETRRWSFTSKPIPWTAHRSWFQGKLASPACAFYIAVDARDRAVGCVRFELDGSREAEISVNLAPKSRGQGRGAILLMMALQEFLRNRGRCTVRALIKPDNEASKRAFGKAGFSEKGRVRVKGQAALKYIATKAVL